MSQGAAKPKASESDTLTTNSRQPKKHRKRKPAVKFTVPTKPADMSSNWKKLQQTLPGKPKFTAAGTLQLSPKKKADLNTNVKKLTSRTNLIGKVNAANQKEPEIWFDDVDEDLLDLKPSNSTKEAQNGEHTLIRQSDVTGVTNAVAMDCEMVGVGTDGKESIVARVSIVNLFGHCLYDKYVKPTEWVTDYRTAVSGIRPQDIANGVEFSVVQKEVCDILKGRILVGHAVNYDLRVLYLNHPRSKIRDTARYRPLRSATGMSTPSLKKLTSALLGIDIQQGEHNSVQDAQAAMRIYTMYKREWESKTKRRGKPKNDRNDQDKTGQATVKKRNR